MTLRLIDQLLFVRQLMMPLIIVIVHQPGHLLPLFEQQKLVPMHLLRPLTVLTHLRQQN